MMTRYLIPVFAFVLLMPHVNAIAAAPDLRPKEWRVDPAPGQPNQFLLTVDTRNLPTNIYLDNVHAWIGFYDENKSRVTAQDISLGDLRGGEVFKVQKGYASVPQTVAFMRGDTLEVRGKASVRGGKSDTLYPTIQASSGFIPTKTLPRATPATPKKKPITKYQQEVQ